MVQEAAPPAPARTPAEGFAPLGATDVVLERVTIDRHFHRWLRRWSQHGGVRVLVAQDGSHAVAVALSGHEPDQLPIPGVEVPA